MIIATVVVALVLVVAIVLAVILPPPECRPPNLPPPGPPAHWPGCEKPGCLCWQCSHARVADYADAERMVARNAVLREMIEAKLPVSERCESDAPDCGPVEFRDVDDVPLCRRCWDALAIESNTERRMREAGWSVVDGGPVT
jgi:hypothetical protein